MTQTTPETDATSRLPIDDALPQLLAALAAHRNAVLVAPPGAGKTTRVPLALLAAPWRADGRIVMLEPRRLAARGAAARMAETLGEEVGETVGLRARLDTRVGPRTRIEVVTEGVFARMILDDPELPGIAAVIFDEFHERSLDADFGLALALDVQSGLREDLRILAMSATLDGARAARLLGTGDAPAPVVESQGRAFPVETRYIGRDPARRIEEDVAAAVRAALAAESGSILVFLPGQAEIRRVENLLKEWLAGPRAGGQTCVNPVDIAPLHGQLDRAAQNLAIRPSAAGRRKVVLATSIAETSLTIEGVRVVIDSGLARVPRFEPGIGITRLETVRASLAASDQRRGRAGRTQPGVCYRLWEEAANGALPAYSTPEILAADLAPLVLDCARWGVEDPATLAFLDPPPAAALAEARLLLQALGALDARNRLTDTDRALQSLPLPPRLARMVVEARRTGDGGRAAEIAAVLVERGLGGSTVDLAERVQAFRRDRSPRAADMRRLARQWGGPPESGDAAVGALLALAFPDRIAKARGRDGTYLLANGRGAALDLADPLAREDFLAVAEIVGTAASGRIVSAAALTREEVEALAAGRITEGTEVTFDREARALRARRTRRLGAIVLDRTPLPAPADDASALVLARGIADIGLASLPWTKALSQWRARIGFLRRAEGDGGNWPDLSDAALAATVEDWLAPHLAGVTSLARIDAGLLDAALKSLLTWDLQQRLEREAPTHFTAPTGSRIAVDYDGDTPAIAVRVQELFGLADHPAIAQGRIPLTLELLSPAHRPIQITRDLPGFWRGSWSAVRAEMRGRYPRHVWPEDPAAATATTRAKPRGN